MFVPITHQPRIPPVDQTVARRVTDGLRLVGLLLTIAGWLVVAGVSDGARALFRLLRRREAPPADDSQVPDPARPALR
jgi:hypothetical protein